VSSASPRRRVWMPRREFWTTVKAYAASCHVPK